MANAILNRDEVRLYWGGTTNLSDDMTTLLDGDGSVDGIINRVSAQVEEIIDNKVVDTEVTRIMNGSGCRYLDLPFFPIIDLAGASDAAKLANLQYRDAYDDAWVDLLDDVDKYRIDPDRPYRITLVDGSSVPSGYDNIRCVWRAGYTFDNVPRRMREIALQMSLWFYRESAMGGGVLGKSSESVAAAGGSMTTGYTDMVARWTKELQPWRKLVL